MKSKLIITLTAFFIFAGILSAQSEKPFRFGVIGGMNLSNVKADLDNRVGFHAGVKAEYALPLNFYLESGLLFTRKGYKIDLIGSGYTTDEDGNAIIIVQKIKGKANKNLLELPIHIGYKLKLHPKISIFANTGVYFGYGLSGKGKGTVITGTSSILPFDDRISDADPSTGHTTLTGETIHSKIYSGEDSEKRFDWGLGLKAGVELFDRLQISASYDWGMNKLYSDTSEGNNRNFMVSCAFMIF